MRILMADDEPIFLDTLARRLTRRGHTVETANNGREAFEIFEETPDSYDLVLTDIKMPEHDGLELLKQIRRNDYDVPVIIMTGHGDLEQSIQALRLGAFDYLVKPLELHKLYTSLSRLESLSQSQKRITEILPFVNGEIEIGIPSKIKYIESVVSYCISHVRQMRQLYYIDIYKISLCLQEALANAIIHGNLEVPSALKEESWEEFEELRRTRESDPHYSDRQVRLRFQFHQEQMRFEIEDQGNGFDTSKLPDYNNPSTLLASGRGLLYIFSFMDEVSWNESGNMIRMIKKLSKE